MTDLSGIQSAMAGAVQDLANDLLADLLGSGPKQHTRLLRLHTSLGPDVLLAERAHIQEGIGPSQHASPLDIELLALSRNAHLQPGDLMGQPVLLELLTAHSRTELRPFHGHVLACELLGSDGGYARYRLQVGSWLEFLRHRTDAWIFQDQSVIDITEAVFADYQGQGALQPKWRWDLRQRESYPRLSTLAQFNETDFDFLQRLWSDNGLFCWFEHTGSPNDCGAQGTHTLVIADHNGAFAENPQNTIRFTQSAASLGEDSITQWHGVRRVGPTQLHTASFDYRSVGNHAASLDLDAAHDQPMPLVHRDQPGAYAYKGAQEAECLATVQLQALQAQRKQFQGRATVRTLAPATTFLLADHHEHDADRARGGDDAARFVALGVTHRARNNLSADAKAGLQHWLGHGRLLADAASNASEEPLYEARFTAQRVAVPVRAAQRDGTGALLYPKPSALGTQTAIVVGLDGPVHTDRDGRIKVQFHWQRGASSSHRLNPAAPTDASESASCNAPGSDASGTWVRVGQAWSGANWGGVFIPRLGQEVVVAFVEGDMDRPVVIGTTYNGEGAPNAQANAVASGPANATGNAPAWFPGAVRAGEHEGHAHAATLSGFKSQSLDASQTGAGGHNQLVFDDTPGQGRVWVHTTQSQTWLQMGHLLQQRDNQRLSPRGHGLELHTQAQGAIRAAHGLHISTHARPGGTSAGQGQPTNTREARAQLQAHAELLKALGGNAQTHKAQLPHEPSPEQLPAHLALGATVVSLDGSLQTHQGAGGDAGEGDAVDAQGGITAIDGGQGRIPVTQRPDIVLSAAASISSATPAHTVVAVGQHATVTTGQDTNLLAQRHHAWAVKGGISLFTRGEAKDGQRAVQEVGIKLHAASGNVNTQAQSGAFSLTAEKAIDVQSTAANITIGAPNKIILNGGGGYIKIEGGDIEIGSSGPASFKASMKELTGGSSGSGSGLALQSATDLFDEQFVITDDHTGETLPHYKYRIENDAGEVLAQGYTDTLGKTARVTSSNGQKLRVVPDHN